MEDDKIGKGLGLCKWVKAGYLVHVGNLPAMAAEDRENLCHRDVPKAKPAGKRGGGRGVGDHGYHLVSERFPPFSRRGTEIPNFTKSKAGSSRQQKWISSPIREIK